MVVVVVFIDIHSFPTIHQQHGDIDEEIQNFESESQFVTTLGLKITKSLETHNI